AAYVGEDVVLRYDPRDVAEVRVFHRDRFLCRAVCQELAGATVTFREIATARNRRRRELRQTLDERRRLVDSLLEPNAGPTSSPARPRRSPRGSWRRVLRTEGSSSTRRPWSTPRGRSTARSAGAAAPPARPCSTVSPGRRSRNSRPSSGTWKPKSGRPTATA